MVGVFQLPRPHVFRPLRPALALSLYLLVAAWGYGCSSFAVVERDQAIGVTFENERGLRLKTGDGHEFRFQSGHYTLHWNSDSTLRDVKGWGEKHGPYGLVDRGFYDIAASDIVELQREQVHAIRTAAFVAGVIGVGVMLYLGVQSLSTGGGRDSGEGPSPPAPL